MLPGLKDSFADEGLSLDYADSWAKGMDLFHVVVHELVIADYDLRETKTGLQLLAELKQLAPSTRLILISGRLTPEAEAIVKKQGEIDIYLTRSSPDLLQILVEEARQAEQRAEASDWKGLGMAHPQAEKVNLEEIAKVEESLRVRLRAPR